MRLAPATCLLALLISPVAHARVPEPLPPRDPAAASAADSLPRPHIGDAAGEWLWTTLSAPAPANDSLGDVRTELRRVYADRHWNRLWTAGGWPSPTARRILQVIRSAAVQGLDPGQFDTGVFHLAAAGMAPPAAPPTPAEQARFDLRLSVSVARYMGAMYSGRVAPSFAHPTLHWRGQVLDRVRMLDSLARSPRPDTLLARLVPSSREYARLAEALPRYRAAGSDSVLIRLAARKPALRLGDRYPDARALGSLLSLADVAPNPKLAGTPRDSVVTRELLDRVQRLERRDSTHVDVTLGAHAARTLRHDLTDKATVVALAMERQRWLTREFPLPPIIVNIPAFDLRYWRASTDDSGLVMQMKVQAGRADSTETPMLSDRLRAVIFRPYWDIPVSIMRKEVLPKALADSSYIRHQGYELVRGYGAHAPVVPVDSANIAAIGHAVRVRQPPGPANALGDVKFQLSNDESIYMHDTPQRGLFTRSRRDFSHGCIRLQNAPGLAEYLLRDHADWPVERIHAAARADTQAVVGLVPPIPVEIVYWTARTREDGSIEFLRDIYGHDHTLDSLMRLPFPLPR